MTTPGSPARRFIKDGALLPGDIVLTTTPAKLSATIRKVTSADISHAMLCVADGSVIDSTGEGVHARNPQWMVVEPGCAFHLLRPAAPVTCEQLQTLIRYAREQVSMPYTKVGAVQALLKKGRITRHQFCSRLVAQAYRAAGIPLVPDADRCTPAELLQSPLLVEIHDALRELTPAEEEALASRVDRTQLMRDVTNDLIAGARKIAPGIDTLNDIDLHLQSHPEADAALCQVLISSSYLDVWRGEEIRHPWQYPFVAFAMAQGLAGTRGEADALKAEFAVWIRGLADKDSEDWIDPQRFLQWMRSRETSPEEDSATPRRIDVKLSGARGTLERYNVLPVQHQESVHWIDPAGFELAQSNQSVLVTASAHRDDFELSRIRGRWSVRRRFHAG